MAGIDAALKMLAELGANVLEIQSAPLSEYAACNRTILSSEVYAIQRKWLRELPQDYASLTHERFIRRLRTRRRLYQRHSRTRQAD